MAKLLSPSPDPVPKYKPSTVRLVVIVVLSGNPTVVVESDVETSISFTVPLIVSAEEVVHESVPEPSVVKT